MSRITEIENYMEKMGIKTKKCGVWAIYCKSSGRLVTVYTSQDKAIKHCSRNSSHYYCFHAI